ncbi:MAG: CDP-diacylglycerol--glycerol-3-phosphate 3-phosphatidyltransferase [Phycisphaerales bacterium]|nr:CDP-diacylglycerol--glycerol-3-phosphate 3-phosphatidyltransferase [Phycisphaerales bacterium]
MSDRPAATGFRRHVPNALTLARLVLAGAFIWVLSVYHYPRRDEWALWVGIVLFVVAALTDAADGYLARRWNAVSVFGRVMDPFADKLLVLGAFVVMAGPQFWSAELGRQSTGVLPWMAVVILGRELLVTSIRGVMEGMGVDFSASWTGKAKMIVQSVAVPAILLLLVFSSDGSVNPLGDRLMPARAASINSIIAYVVTAVTVISAVPYVTRAMGAMRGRVS